MVIKKTEDIIILPPQNLMLIALFYQLLLIIRYFILLGGFKLGDEVLDLSVLGDIFIENGTDGKSIFDDSHEC